MAQLGDLVRAKALLRSAARTFCRKEAVVRARCVVAEAEIALVSRDLGWPAKALDAAPATLEAHGDRVNASHARNLESDGDDQFYCGGGSSGKVKTVRRPRRGSAAGSGSEIPVNSTSK